LLKFLVDNALSPFIAEGLRSAGHDSIHIRDYNMQKTTDLEVFARASEEGRTLVSADTDLALYWLCATKKNRLSFPFGVAPNVPQFNCDCCWRLCL
jgi:predicted nuclease of predicted toxin-antitoxin system